VKNWVFIHRSIKTRIETCVSVYGWSASLQFLYIDPLKQGLKQVVKVAIDAFSAVFIHRSIKTRIETETIFIFIGNACDKFLYIDPLKQGLKPA